jgi:hypothetical protein
VETHRPGDQKRFSRADVVQIPGQNSVIRQFSSVNLAQPTSRCHSSIGRDAFWRRINSGPNSALQLPPCRGNASDRKIWATKKLIAEREVFSALNLPVTKSSGRMRFSLATYLPRLNYVQRCTSVVRPCILPETSPAGRSRSRQSRQS